MTSSATCCCVSPTMWREVASSSSPTCRNAGKSDKTTRNDCPGEGAWYTGWRVGWCIGYDMTAKTWRLITYNIHKGVAPFRSLDVIDRVRLSLKESRADFLLLQ